MQSLCGATAADIRPASLMMWESYSYVKDKEPKDFFYDLLINEPELDPEQLRLLWIDGRIAATVLVARREMFDGKEKLILGGIGDVAVHPDFRGRGLSVQILQNAVDYMIEKGFHVSTLYSGHEGLYEKVGYTRLSGRGFVKGVVPGAPTSFERSKDWSVASKLFAGSVSKLPGGMIRSEEFWKTYIGGRWLPSADIVYSDDKSAYVIMADGAEPGSIDLADAGYADSIDQLKDLLRTKFAGLHLNSPSADLQNPLIIAVKSVVAEPSVEIACGLMARTLCEKPMPFHFLDMSVDRF